MKNTRHKEIEFKYDATSVSLNQFNKAVVALKPKRIMTIGGWDHYYSNGKGHFRHRLDKKRPELTSKRRINKGSVTNRDEINIHLEPGTKPTDMRKLMECAGFPFDFAIFKTSTIHFFKDVDVCHYTVYDQKRRKIGQFIEIEFMTHIKNKKTSYKMKRIREFEKALSSLGLNPSKRLNKSLFEIYSTATTGMKK